MKRGNRVYKISILFSSKNFFLVANSCLVVCWRRLWEKYSYFCEIFEIFCWILIFDRWWIPTWLFNCRSFLVYGSFFAFLDKR